MSKYILFTVLLVSGHLPVLSQKTSISDTKKIEVGNSSIDYSHTFNPYEAQWDLVINGRTVGSATTHLRYAIVNGESVYHTGSVIRYISMGNKPFADISIFSKNDYGILRARNAISQEDEITSTFTGLEMKQYNMNINSGLITEEKTVKLNDRIFGSDIMAILSMELQEGLVFQLPILGIDNVQWEEFKVIGREAVVISGQNKGYNAWQIESTDGTTKWIIDKAPYLVKWQMPTGMEWELKGYTD